MDAGAGRHVRGAREIPRPKVEGPTNVDLKLEASSGLTRVAGSDVYGRTYERADFVGPTIHVQPGDTIRVSFENNLGTRPDEQAVLTNIHYHGLHVSPEKISDNIFRTFQPKPDKENPYASVVKLEPNQPVGTYWYHAHFHGISDGQVLGGMSGLIMIDGLKRLLPDDFKGVPERQITLRDVQISKDKADDGHDIIASDRSEIDPAPRQTFRMVNGQYKPKFTMPAGKYELWHLANVGADVYYKVGLAKHGDNADLQSFFILAEDGLPVWEVVSKQDLLIPPGKRFDVLVRARAAGTYELLTLPYAQTNNDKLNQDRQIPCTPSAPEVGWPDCKPEARRSRRSPPPATARPTHPIRPQAS